MAASVGSYSQVLDILKEQRLLWFGVCFGMDLYDTYLHKYPSPTPLDIQLQARGAFAKYEGLLGRLCWMGLSYGTYIIVHEIHSISVAIYIAFSLYMDNLYSLSMNTLFLSSNVWTELVLSLSVPPKVHGDYCWKRTLKRPKRRNRWVNLKWAVSLPLSEDGHCGFIVNG